MFEEAYNSALWIAKWDGLKRLAKFLCIDLPDDLIETNNNRIILVALISRAIELDNQDYRERHDFGNYQFRFYQNH